MQLKNLFSEKRAVSPVIGVILMVAITVILAAVIGTFVLGLGDSIGETTPSASYSWDEDSDSVSLTHMSGQNLDAARLSATVNGTSVDDFGDVWADDDGVVSSGDRVTFVENEGGEEENREVELSSELGSPTDSDTEYRVIWTASGGGSSSTLTTYTVN